MGLGCNAVGPGLFLYASPVAPNPGFIHGIFILLQSVPLLGADFLQHFDLLVDVKGCRIVHTQSPKDVNIHASPNPVPAFCRASFLSAPQCLQKLLSEFPEVLSSDGFTASKPCHGVCHNLLTKPGPPVYAKPGRLNPEKLAAANAKFYVMEKAGIIRLSSSPWSSPLHMVKKKDGGHVETIEG